MTNEPTHLEMIKAVYEALVPKKNADSKRDKIEVFKSLIISDKIKKLRIRKQD